MDESNARFYRKANMISFDQPRSGYCIQIRLNGTGVRIANYPNAYSVNHDQLAHFSLADYRQPAALNPPASGPSGEIQTRHWKYW
jgi:hypothetical protein